MARINLIAPKAPARRQTHWQTALEDDISPLSRQRRAQYYDLRV